MNTKIKESLIKNLEKLISDIKNDNSSVVEIEFGKHFKPVLIVEKELYYHELSGDNMITIRFRNSNNSYIK